MKSLSTYIIKPNSGQRNTKIPLASAANTFLSSQTCFCCKIDFEAEIKCRDLGRPCGRQALGALAFFLVVPGIHCCLAPAEGREERETGKKERRQGSSQGQEERLEPVSRGWALQRLWKPGDPTETRAFVMQRGGRVAVLQCPSREPG